VVLVQQALNSFIVSTATPCLVLHVQMPSPKEQGGCTRLASGFLFAQKEKNV
jgi:hypothetical protein